MDKTTINIDGHNFPWTWRYLLPEDWQFLKLPSERCASCLDCPKVHSDQYLPNTKCCTYTPRIPNFILGQIALEMPKFFEELTASGLLTPEGLQASPIQLQHSLHQYNENRFGKSEETICPMLDRSSGLCRIHDKRNAVCSTYFCINDHGSQGLEFWNSLRDYIGQMETALCQWAMQECGMDLTEYFTRYNSLGKDFDACSNATSKGWSEHALKILWSDFYEEQKEFYIKTFEVFSKNLDHLLEIAEKTDIKEPLEFDEKIVAWLDHNCREIYLSEVPSRGGKALAPSQILYETNATLRNIWNIEFGVKYSTNPDLEIHPLKASDTLASYYLGKNISHLGKLANSTKSAPTPLSQSQVEIIKTFESGSEITNDLLYSDKYDFNMHSFLQECIHLKLIVPI